MSQACSPSIFVASWSAAGSRVCQWQGRARPHKLSATASSISPSIVQCSGMTARLRHASSCYSTPLASLPLPTHRRSTRQALSLLLLPAPRTWKICKWEALTPEAWDSISNETTTTFYILQPITTTCFADNSKCLRLNSTLSCSCLNERLGKRTNCHCTTYNDHQSSVAQYRITDTNPEPEPVATRLGCVTVNWRVINRDVPSGWRIRTGNGVTLLVSLSTTRYCIILPLISQMWFYALL